jgi:hypothetical protein
MLHCAFASFDHCVRCACVLVAVSAPKVKGCNFTRTKVCSLHTFNHHWCINSDFITDSAASSKRTAVSGEGL